jgi:hypothetical protein
VVQTSNAFLVIAFKLNGSAAEAMAQIKGEGILENIYIKTRRLW